MLLFRSGTALALRSRAIVRINVIPVDKPDNAQQEHQHDHQHDHHHSDKRLNKHPPQFEQRIYFVRVREDFPVGTLVTRLRAHDLDQDPATKIHYFIRRGNEDGRFSIDETMCNIRIKKPLDYEKRPFYNLTIVAKDDGLPNSLSSTVSLVIEVEDIDENRFAPKFPDIYATGQVKENAPNGTFVMQVRATDEDSPSTGDQGITYQLVDGDGLGKFVLHPDGKIFTNTVLDRETNWRHWLTVVAKDKAAVPKTGYIHVFIEVLNENDCAPVTLEPFYYVDIPENATVSSDVLQLSAKDDDVPEEEFVFNYKILNEEDVPFKIVKTTGLIQTKDVLDREHQSLYVLDIEVSEAHATSGPTLSSRTPVVIRVTDVNDNDPATIQTIVRCQAYNTLSNDIPICQVIAWDLDDMIDDEFEQNGHLQRSSARLPRFNITEGNERNYFAVNEATGQLFFANDSRDLDAPIPKKTYELVVRTCRARISQTYSNLFATLSNLESSRKLCSPDAPRAHFFLYPPLHSNLFLSLSLARSLAHSLTLPLRPFAGFRHRQWRAASAFASTRHH